MNEQEKFELVAELAYTCGLAAAGSFVTPGSAEVGTVRVNALEMLRMVSSGEVTRERAIQALRTAMGNLAESHKKELNIDAIENRLDFGSQDAWVLAAEVRRLRDHLAAAKDLLAERQKVFVLIHEDPFGVSRVEGLFSSQQALHQFATRRLNDFRTSLRIQAVEALEWDENGVARIDRRVLGDHPTFQVEEHVVDAPSTAQSPA